MSNKISQRRRTYIRSAIIYTSHHIRLPIIGASLSEPHCYVANRGKRNALWCVRTRNFSTVIKIHRYRRHRFGVTPNRRIQDGVATGQKHKKLYYELQVFGLF